MSCARSFAKCALTSRSTRTPRWRRFEAFVRTRLTSWTVIVGGALLATVLTYWERNHRVPEILQPLADALNFIHTSAFLLSALASHNVHADSTALTYALLFLIYALLLAILVGIVRWAARE